MSGIPEGNPANGAKIFKQRCAQCHTVEEVTTLVLLVWLDWLVFVLVVPSFKCLSCQTGLTKFLTCSNRVKFVHVFVSFRAASTRLDPTFMDYLDVKQDKCLGLVTLKPIRAKV